MNFELFLETLPIMLKGMLGIFAVTFIIMLSIVILNVLTSHKNKNGEKK